jgi:site-specific recombinase XerD
MSAAEFFVFPRTIHRMYAGPLGPFIDAFSGQLQQHGYSRRSIRHKIQTAANFSHWLKRHGLNADDVGANQQNRFLIYRKRLGRCTRDDPAALRQIAAVVHGQDLTYRPDSSAALNDRDRALEDCKTYLLQDRGLATKTVMGYLLWISRFLSECCTDRCVRFDLLTCTDVTGFVQRHVHERSHSTAQTVVKALRAFFRYLHHHGKIASDLSACVPSVAGWSFATLPAFLHPDQVGRVLEQCDRRSAQGRRDYAMLLLFARLGLRAGEVVALTLDDIDWDSGCLVIRNKGGRWTQMPLPQEVGEAIADYLVNGRPSCIDRHVFIRDHAPRTGFASSSSASSVVSRAFVRAGIDVPRGGAHLFRHSLATEMLRQGASLAEIGELLRHQHPDTTRLYAKVDLQALRALARPWPGGAR